MTGTKVSAPAQNRLEACLARLTYVRNLDYGSGIVFSFKDSMVVSYSGTQAGRVTGSVLCGRPIGRIRGKYHSREVEQSFGLRRQRQR